MIPSEIKQYYKGISDYDVDAAIFDYGRFLIAALVCANRSDMSRQFEHMYNTFEKWAHATPWQLHQENVDFEMGLEDWSFFKRVRYLPVSILMPAGQRINELSWRERTDTEALITIIAAIRFKQQNGNYPERLDELVEAGFLKKLPLDPWSDKALVYKRTDGDFMLYGLGENFTDEGGKVFRDKDGRTKVWGDEGDAVFWPVNGD